MGTLGNSLFQGMLGWLRTLVQTVWTMISSPGDSGLPGWIVEHWVPLALGLCAAGLIIDLAVYLFRWQPYRAWKSFFLRRRTRREATPKDVEAYAGEEDVPAAVRNAALKQQQAEIYGRPKDSEESATGRTAASGRKTEEEEPLFSYTLPTWRNEEEEESYTARFEQAIRPRRRRASVRNIFADEPTPQEATAPQDLIDSTEAYREPVYPKKWNDNRKGEE